MKPKINRALLVDILNGLAKERGVELIDDQPWINFDAMNVEVHKNGMVKLSFIYKNREISTVSCYVVEDAESATFAMKPPYFVCRMKLDITE